MEIRIYKSKRLLEYIDSRGKNHQFPIGIGRTDLGHKECEGDGKTPEGEYSICVKNPKSKFHLSLGLNYPNRDDAQAAHRKGMISKTDLEEILRRQDRNQGSLWSTKLGGAIYIHGDLEKQSWSEGCVRMFNKDIASIFEQIEIGTKVIIFP